MKSTPSSMCQVAQIVGRSGHGGITTGKAIFQFLKNHNLMWQLKVLNLGIHNKGYHESITNNEYTWSQKKPKDDFN